jgi:hypothetical protein
MVKPSGWLGRRKGVMQDLQTTCARPMFVRLFEVGEETGVMKLI